MKDSKVNRAIGLAQRLLIWAMLASLVGWLIPFAFLIAIPFQLYCVYKLAQALQMGTAISILFLIAMVIPFVSLVCLLALNNAATRDLKEAGIKVGLMGAKPSSLPPAES